MFIVSHSTTSHNIYSNHVLLKAVLCIFQMVEDTVREKTGQQTKAIEDMTLDELDEIEDEEDDRVLLQYR